jgi:hypothetical protein
VKYRNGLQSHRLESEPVKVAGAEHRERDGDEGEFVVSARAVPELPRSGWTREHLTTREGTIRGRQFPIPRSP